MGRGALGKGTENGTFRLFQNVQMTKTVGGRKWREKTWKKKKEQNRKDIAHLPKSLDFLLYMVRTY